MAGIAATFSIRPEMKMNFGSYPWGFVFPIAGAIGLAGIWFYNRRGKDARTFLSSTLFIVGMLGGTAFALYPNLLPSSTDPSFSLTAQKVAAQHYGLTVGLTWWILGMALTSGYFIYLYRSFRGKVNLSSNDAGY
jgi:cytochrome d ubiquinol oxidase subunit II